MSDAPVKKPTPTDASLLPIHPAPHWHGTDSINATIAAWILAATIPAIAAILNFGTAAVSMMAVSVATALLTEAAVNGLMSFRGQAGRGWEAHALITGLLVALCLPSHAATLSLYIPVLAAAGAVVVGRVLAGGHGNYLWHPAAVGRIIVQLAFGSTLAARATESTGSSLPSAIQGLVALSTGSLVVEPGCSPITVLVRDHLPPWGYTLFGLPTAGLGPPIGGCTIALLIAALVLAWRGHVRLGCVLSGIGAAAIAAFVLPVSAGGGNGTLWMPGRVIDEGLPVGCVYVLYQLTSGEFLLVLLLLAGDSVSSPLTARGHRWFGAGIGVLTIALRNYGLADTAGFWALLAMNSLVPLIDRLTKRRVYGTA